MLTEQSVQQVGNMFFSVPMVLSIKFLRKTCRNPSCSTRMGRNSLCEASVTLIPMLPKDRARGTTFPTTFSDKCKMQKLTTKHLQTGSQEHLKKNTHHYLVGFVPRLHGTYQSCAAYVSLWPEFTTQVNNRCRMTVLTMQKRPFNQSVDRGSARGEHILNTVKTAMAV